MTQEDPEATVLRPRRRSARPQSQPGAWDNVEAWRGGSADPPPAGPAPAPQGPPRGHHVTPGLVPPPNARGPRGPERAPVRGEAAAPGAPARATAAPGRPDAAPRPPEHPAPGPRPATRVRRASGPLRRTAPARPEPVAAAPEASPRQRAALIAITAGVLATIALLLPTLLVPSEAPTGRALSVAHGPLPRRADVARLPGTLGDLRRDARADNKQLPFSHVDHAVYADASCGRRYDALTCTMLLEGGTLAATTVDPAWEPEALAGLVRVAYAGLPQQ